MENNINPINFNQNLNVAQKPAGLVDTPMNEGNRNPYGHENPPAQNPPQNFILQPSISKTIDYEALLMDKQTVLRYVQNLFKFPDSIDKFINELKTNTDSKTLEFAAKILKENLIDVKVLNELLNENSKDAIQKLLQTMTTVLRTSGSDAKQLKEVLTLLNIIQTNTNLNTNSIKEFLLLYIPLNIADIKDNYNFALNEENGANNSSDNISIMFQSVNFSNIMIILNDENNYIYLDFYLNELFPFEQLERILNLSSKELNFNLSFEKHETKADNFSDKQNFSVNTNGSISTNALLLTHLIIKSLVLIDNGFT